jgi:hypothetical protein
VPLCAHSKRQAIILTVKAWCENKKTQVGKGEDECCDVSPLLTPWHSVNIFPNRVSSHLMAHKVKNYFNWYLLISGELVFRQVTIFLSSLTVSCACHNSSREGEVCCISSIFYRILIFLISALL